MELLHGMDLAKVMDNRSGLPVERAVGPDVMVTDGLVAPHAAGIVHRDPKPANLFVEPGGQLKICDFGIARDNTATSQRGHANSVGGTPLYAPPEWRLGTRWPSSRPPTCTRRGHPPREAGWPRSILDSPSLADLPVPPHKLNPAVPMALSDLGYALPAVRQ